MGVAHSTMRKYAEQDIGTIIAKLNELESAGKVSKKTVEFDEGTYPTTGEEYLDVDLTLEASGVPINVQFSYNTQGPDIYLETSVDNICQKVLDELNSGDSVAAATTLSGRRIVAADEDPDSFADEDFGEIPSANGDDSEGGISDAVNDLGDQVQDLQDAVDDQIDEDEPGLGIELDNNISRHYIAECDRCHGVFISAVIASDQDVDKISGVCPLCDKHTDQYLKWIIEDVNKK